jgi:hypothetical protein
MRDVELEEPFRKKILSLTSRLDEVTVVDALPLLKAAQGALVAQINSRE